MFCIVIEFDGRTLLSLLAALTSEDVIAPFAMARRPSFLGPPLDTSYSAFPSNIVIAQPHAHPLPCLPRLHPLRLHILSS